MWLYGPFGIFHETKSEAGLPKFRHSSLVQALVAVAAAAARVEASGAVLGWALSMKARDYP